jgi:predicted lipoprotein
VTETAEFARRAEVLRDASVRHEASRTEESAGQAAAAWQAAADQWQVLEVFQYGPAAMSSQPGGLELRNQIYIWPLFNRCLIEQLLVNRALGDATFAAQFDRFANARGLGAIEYLLFHSGSDNVCPAANPINKNGTWAGLGQTDLEGAKAGYVRVTAEDIHRRAETLASAWATEGGNFRDTLARAGSGSALFATAHAGFNAVSDALFYLHTETKDMKLATPMGLTETCLSAPCPWLVESPFAGRSKENVRNNLLGFQKLFSGCSSAADLGFDDLLADVGQAGLAERMSALIGVALAAVDAIEEPSLEGALVGDMQSVWALYDAVKAISDLLKTDFVSVLNLGRPPSAGTDND